MSLPALIGVHLAFLFGANFTTPHIDYTAILPELILMGGALVMVGVAAVSVRPIATTYYAAITMAIAVAALIASLVLWHDVGKRGPFTAVANSISVDGFSVLFLILICVALFLSALFGEGYLRREGINGPEYYVLAALSGSGAMLMAAAGDLIIIFLGLEILSIALYVLAGMDTRRAQSGEAAMKYFILGAFSSAIFVYGIALTYGATGSTNIAQIAAYLAHNPSPSDGLLLAGLGLLIVGFCFKVAAVPFHMWTPDVYQGAPTPVTGFMASVAKAGGFAALLRVLLDSFPTLRDSWQPMIWVVAFLSLLGGAVIALVQRDVKRMLAYSSINHAGFVLVGLQAASQSGLEGALYYLFAYSVIIVGTFGLVAFIGLRGERGHDLDDYRGLAQRRPVVALALTLLLMAQAGIPFTTGFLSKFYVIAAAVSAHSYALAVIAMVSAAIAAFFYLRVVAYMYIGTRLGSAVATAGRAGAVELATVPAVPAYVPADAASVSLVLGEEQWGSADGVGGAPDGDAAGAADGGAGPGDDDEGEEAIVHRPTLDERLAREGLPLSAALAVGLSLGVTILFGVWPQPLFDFVHAAKLIF